MVMWKIAALIGSGMVLATTASAQEPTGSGEGFSYPYPRQSLKMREEGTVHYRVRVSKTGDLENCEVTQSSGYSRLDRETCRMLIQHARFTPKMTENGRRMRSTRDGKIVWKIS
jgi:TonB family protein